jgi:hypothetical protein
MISVPYASVRWMAATVLAGFWMAGCPNTPESANEVGASTAVAPIARKDLRLDEWTGELIDWPHALPGMRKVLASTLDDAMLWSNRMPETGKTKPIAKTDTYATLGQVLRAMDALADSHALPREKAVYRIINREYTMEGRQLADGRYAFNVAPASMVIMDVPTQQFWAMQHVALDTGFWHESLASVFLTDSNLVQTAGIRGISFKNPRLESYTCQEEDGAQSYLVIASALPPLKSRKFKDIRSLMLEGRDCHQRKYPDQGRDISSTFCSLPIWRDQGQGGPGDYHPVFPACTD